MKWLAAFTSMAMLPTLTACGGSECGLTPQCAGLTTMYQCQGKEVAQVECPEQSFCQLDAKQAPECVPGFVVSGLATYGKRAASASGLGEPVQKPIPHASCSVVDDTGAVLGTSFTKADGSFSIAYQPKGGAMVHVTVATLASPASKAPLRVNAKSGVYGYADTSFTAELLHTKNVVITDSVASQTFNVFTTALESFTHLFGVTSRQWPTLQYVIYPGSPGSYYQSATDTISLLLNGSDSDGFDDAVIGHEFGHYVQYRIATPNSDGGEHTGGPADPLLAWSEGFASYYSSSSRADPLYIDTYADSSKPGGSGAFVFDLRSDEYLAEPTKPVTQDISEWLVSEILWSIEDTSAGGLGKPPTATLGVLAKLTNQTDRGVGGVDLVDFLDTWLATRGTDDCTGLRGVLSRKGFPYDFAPPGHACP